MRLLAEAIKCKVSVQQSKHRLSTVFFTALWGDSARSQNVAQKETRAADGLFVGSVGHGAFRPALSCAT